MGKRKTKKGDKFGLLTVGEVFMAKAPSGVNVLMARCRCSCKDQTVKDIHASNLRSGKVYSCGCIRKRKGVDNPHATVVAGYSDDKRSAYRIWQKRRRDGRLCKAWLDFDVFWSWLVAQGYDRPNHKIVAINAARPLSPKNTELLDGTYRGKHFDKDGKRTSLAAKLNEAGISRQAYYKRLSRGMDATEAAERPRVLDAKKYRAFGQRRTIAEWYRDERCVVTYETLRSRLRADKNVEWAITTPSRKKKKSK